MKNKKIHHIAFIIENNFSMFELSAILEPFNLASNSNSDICYDYKIYSSDGREKQANCQSIIATEHLGTLNQVPTIVFILSSCESSFSSSLLQKQLRNCINNQECMIVGVNEGVSWLYQSKIIGDNYFHNGVLEATDSGSVKLRTGRLYSIQNNIILCAGGSSCLDMALKLISIIHDKQLSISTAEQLSCSMIRSSKHHRFETSTNTLTWPKELKDAIQLMRANLKEPLKIVELYRHLGITAYQLHLLFKQYIGTTPIDYYSELRLMRVQELLSESDLSITEIGLEAGYNNLNTLYARFKKRYGVPPGDFKKYSAF